MPIETATPRYRAFGFLRFFLAFVVVTGHAAWLIDGTPLGAFIVRYTAGSAAVMTFFALSGFILCEAALTFYRNRPLAFLQNRALKIGPMFLGALGLSILVHLLCASFGLLLQGIGFEGYKQVPERIFGLGNMAYNVLSVVPWINSRAFTPDPYLFVRYVWAVRVEVVFYATLFCVITFRPPVEGLLRRHGQIVVGAFAAFVLFNEFVWRVSDDLRYAGYFMLGVAFYFWTQDRARLLTVGIAAALSVAHAVVFFGYKFGPLLPLVLFLGLAAYLSQLSVTASQARLDRKFGDLSYALYLTHYPVLVGYSGFRHVLPSGTAGWVLVLAVCVCVAAVMHVLIEKPVARLRDRTRGRTLALPQDHALLASRA